MLWQSACWTRDASSELLSLVLHELQERELEVCLIGGRGAIRGICSADSRS